MRRRIRELVGNDSANVAPIVALSLTALIAAGGIAFDYARLVSLDTELQNAADQAALAAASQLDREANACARANSAAQTLVANQTLFANDSGGQGVTLPSEPACDQVGSIRFYQDKNRTPAVTDAEARFVEVTVNGRTANFTLTPVVGAISSGVLTGTAFAGMGSAICKVPPLMMCNPNPGTPFNPALLDLPFSAGGLKGIGLKLFQGGGNSWAPGAFGYLDVGAVNNGTPDQRVALGMDFPNTNCVAEAGVEVDTGVAASVLDALNTRFDIYQNGWGKNTCFPHAQCNPAWNTTKDLVRREAASAAACGISNNSSEWRLPPDAEQYVASNAAGDDSNVAHMGYPMDICHYPSGGGCGTTNARFGNGNWRRDIYFLKNHPTQSDPTGSNWQTVTGLAADASRYDVYRWEQNIPGVGNIATGSRPNVSRNMSVPGSGAFTQYGSPVCKPPGLPASAGQPDRRVLAVAVADNCAAINGGSTAVDVGGWAEVFLVQPSVQRGSGGSITSGEEIYVEIIGSTNPTDSGAAAQVVTRDVPFLVE